MALIIWISLIVFVYLLHQILNPKNKKKLPPAPTSFPIIGHFHLLGKNPHQDLRKLSQKHGPIMYMRFGSVGTVVVSSPAAAELVLRTHDIAFANKPHNEASYYLNYEQRNIGFGQYGPYWRNMRKLATLELLSNLKISQFRPQRRAETGLLVKSLEQASRAGETVDMSLKITSLTADITCLMVFGRKFSDRDLDETKGFKDVMKVTAEEAAAFNLGDYFPYLRRFDLQGSTRRLKKLRKIYDDFLERVIDDHLQNKKDHNKEARDFVDTLMGILASGEAGFNFDRRHVKAVLFDMLFGGVDTSAASIEWTLSEVIRHPEVKKKLQQELEQVVGLNQLVEESHLSSLRYLDCVIKETMRLHPIAPLLIHESREECEVNGFHIPNKSRLLVNVSAIGRDPDAWTDPEMFDPERFVGSNVDLRGQHFQLIPFSSGRRGCPGLQLGLTMVQLIVAQLVHCFDWELPDGILPDKLNMSENFGLVTARAEHLMAIPIYRLKI